MGYKRFQKSVRIEDSRRVLSLPKKKKNFSLSSNRQKAENRLKSLEAKLRTNANRRHIYYTQMLVYIQRAHV